VDRIGNDLPPNYVQRVSGTFVVVSIIAIAGLIVASVLGGTNLHKINDRTQGPDSSVDNRVARFDGTTGKLLQESTVALTDTGDLSGINDITLAGTVDGVDVGDHVADATIHFTEGSIDHTAIMSIGTNTHAQIDTHIADATIHFTEASIDHTAITNVGTNTHAQLDTHVADATIHYTEGSIDHTNIVAGDGSDHTFIDQDVTSSGTPTFASVTASALNGGTVEAVSGPGAISPSTLISTVTTTGVDALTLADGTDSQIKIITMIADGGDGTLTPTTLNGGTTLTFDDVGDTVTLVFVNTLGWTILSNNGAVLA
jgi:hypothetical protein